jgi:hypothetical protein
MAAWLRRGQALFPMFDLAMLPNPQLQGEMAMPRPPLVQFPGAIYHVIARGDIRRTLFHDQGHLIGSPKDSLSRSNVRSKGFGLLLDAQSHTRSCTDAFAELGFGHAALALRLRKLVCQTKPKNRSLISRSLQSFARRGWRLLLDTFAIHSLELRQRHSSVGRSTGKLAS